MLDGRALLVMIPVSMVTKMAAFVYVIQHVTMELDVISNAPAMEGQNSIHHKHHGHNSLVLLDSQQYDKPHPSNQQNSYTYDLKNKECECDYVTGWKGDLCDIPGCAGLNKLDCSDRGNIFIIQFPEQF
jgi:hypothetical protein